MDDSHGHRIGARRFPGMDAKKESQKCVLCEANGSILQNGLLWLRDFVWLGSWSPWFRWNISNLDKDITSLQMKQFHPREPMSRRIKNGADNETSFDDYEISWNAVHVTMISSSYVQVILDQHIHISYSVSHIDSLKSMQEPWNFHFIATNIV